MKEKIKLVWKDPVWSKVISAIIISVGVIIYNIVYAFITKHTFVTALIIFLNIDVKLWIILIILIVIFLVKLFYSFKNKTYLYDEKSLELDINLFNKIRNEILRQNDIRWLRTNNFAGFSFKSEYLDPFDNIEYEAQKSDFEFLNPSLEKIKSELIKGIKNLNSFMVPNIFNEGNNRLNVPPEWEIEQAERFNTVVNGIHERAQLVCDKYDQFIRIGRKTLKV